MKEEFYHVLKTDDFAVTGRAERSEWARAAWQRLAVRGGVDDSRASRFKMLYSDRGLYVLMDAEDRALSVTDKADFDDLWTEDVFEFFLWPDERWPVYFEYEISPRARELILLVPNFGDPDKFHGWRPWRYEGERKIDKVVRLRTDRAASGEERLSGWTAEVFVLYDLLKPLQNVPPRAGTRWRANVYRCDYDDGRPVSWNWAPTGPSFHEFKKFATLEFA
ncbi:MAG TPA: carbohydrate-binding family 9-like protein [Thermoguttaceae bacterium]|nr:carbohydrate-binding family 9-like protein [Thermoguttaceae bacterium]